jgi:hypothetical protein
MCWSFLKTLSKIAVSRGVAKTGHFDTVYLIQDNALLTHKTASDKINTMSWKIEILVSDTRAFPREGTNMKFLFFVIIVFSICLFISCSFSIYEKPLVVEIDQLKKNPTSYVFHKSEQDVLNAIIEALGSWKSSRGGRYDDYFLVIHKSGKIKLLPDHGNLSKVYFRKDGSPYRFMPAEFAILLNSENENETKVSINVDRPLVLCNN